MCDAKLHGTVQDVYALFLSRLAVLCGLVQIKACIANTHNSTSRSSAEGLALGLLFSQATVEAISDIEHNHRTDAENNSSDA